MDFKSMTTKKLIALLGTVSDEDRAIIDAILDERANEPKAPTEETETNDTSELHTTAERCKSNIGHLCEVIPFSTTKWENGHIAGVIEEKKTGKVLYAIMLNDGRRIVKVHDSAMLRISDRVISIKKKTRTSRCAMKEWSEEVCQQVISDNMQHVGKTCEVIREEMTDIDGTLMRIVASGRIHALVPNRSAKNVFFKIIMDADEEVVFKTIHSPLLKIGDFDEKGLERNEKYRLKRERRISNNTLVDKIRKAEHKLAKSKEALERKREEIASLETALAELNAQAYSMYNDITNDPLY
jgi:hypothetical protein